MHAGYDSPGAKSWRETRLSPRVRSDLVGLEIFGGVRSHVGLIRALGKYFHPSN